MSERDALDEQIRIESLQDKKEIADASRTGVQTTAGAYIGRRVLSDEARERSDELLMRI